MSDQKAKKTTKSKVPKITTSSNLQGLGAIAFLHQNPELLKLASQVKTNHIVAKNEVVDQVSRKRTLKSTGGKDSFQNVSKHCDFSDFSKATVVESQALPVPTMASNRSRDVEVIRTSDGWKLMTNKRARDDLRTPDSCGFNKNKHEFVPEVPMFPIVIPVLKQRPSSDLQRDSIANYDMIGDYPENPKLRFPDVELTQITKSTLNPSTPVALIPTTLSPDPHLSIAVEPEERIDEFLENQKKISNTAKTRKFEFLGCDGSEPTSSTKLGLLNQKYQDSQNIDHPVFSEDIRISTFSKKHLDSENSTIMLNNGDMFETDSFDFSSGINEKIDKITELGNRLSGIDITKLHQPEKSKKSLGVRGEMVVKNVMKGIQQIKQELGTLSRNTMFQNTAKLFTFLTGVQERTLRSQRKHERKIFRQTRKERRRLAAEKLTSLNQMKLALYLQNCWAQEIHVTLEKIQEYLKSECGFDVARSQLNDMMHGLGYSFRKKTGTPLVEERTDLIAWRSRYLEKKENFENANAFFGFFDETWVFEGMTSEYAWQLKQESVCKIARMGNIDEKRSGPAKGKNKGKRAYVLAVLTKEGILEKSAKVIIPGKDKQLMDYHTMMTASSYEQFMKEIIPIFVEKAKRRLEIPVMIIDNSPLHNATTENVPRRDAKKEILTDFIRKYGGRVKKSWKKPRLQREFDKILAAHGGRYAMRKYKVDEWALKNHGCYILRLPPYHCCFNPIELVWSQLKDYLKREGKTSDKILEVQQRAEIWLNSFTGEAAEKLIEKTRRFEQAIREKIAENRAKVQQTHTQSDSDSDWSSEDSLFSSDSCDESSDSSDESSESSDSD